MTTDNNDNNDNNNNNNDDDDDDDNVNDYDLIWKFYSSKIEFV